MLGADVTDLLEEVVDDLYVRRFWPRRQSPRSAGPRSPSRSARPSPPIPRAALAPPGTNDATARAMRRRLADAVARPSSTGASGRPRSSPTTTCSSSSGHPGRSGAGPGRVRTAPGPLSGRPHRRVPGHRPRAVGHRALGLRRRPARPSCSSAIPSRPSTPSGAPTSSPTSTPPPRPGRRPPLGPTGAATRSSSTPTTPCFDGCQLGHPGITYRPVQAARPSPRWPRLRPPCGCVCSTGAGWRRRPGGTPGSARRGPRAAQDLAAEVVAMLS